MTGRPGWRSKMRTGFGKGDKTGRDRIQADCLLQFTSLLSRQGGSDKSSPLLLFESISLMMAGQYIKLL